MNPEILELKFQEKSCDKENNKALGKLMGDAAGYFYFYNYSNSEAESLSSMIEQAFSTDHHDKQDIPMAIAASLWAENFKFSPNRDRLFSSKFRPSDGYPGVLRNAQIAFEKLVGNGEALLSDGENLESFSAWYRQIEEVVTCSNPLEMQ